jgi:hypothetical protein
MDFNLNPYPYKAKGPAPKGALAANVSATRQRIAAKGRSLTCARITESEEHFWDLSVNSGQIYLSGVVTFDSIPL